MTLEEQQVKFAEWLRNLSVVTRSLADVYHSPLLRDLAAEMLEEMLRGWDTARRACREMLDTYREGK